MIEERNQLQLELSELQSERDRLFEEKASCVVMHAHAMYIHVCMLKLRPGKLES